MPSALEQQSLEVNFSPSHLISHHCADSSLLVHIGCPAVRNQDSFVGVVPLLLGTVPDFASFTPLLHAQVHTAMPLVVSRLEVNQIHVSSSLHT